MVEKLSSQQLAQLNNYIKLHPKVKREDAIKLLFAPKTSQKTGKGLTVEHTGAKQKVEYVIVNGSDGKRYNLNKTIEKRINSVSTKLQNAEKENGFIGSTWSGFKNLTGIGDSSDKVRELIQKEKELLNKFNTNPQKRATFFKQMTGFEYTQENLQKFIKGEIKLPSQLALNGYKEGQAMAVDVGADIASGVTAVGIYSLAVAAVPFTGGTSIAAGVVAAGASGAAIKTGLKAADAATGGREYTLKDAGHDAATGTFSGIIAPVTGGLGGAVGKTVATKLGIQAVKAAGKEVAEEVAETGIKQSIKTALTNPAGYEYVGGNIAKRAVAMTAEMATDGATSGAVDNAFRTTLDGGSLSEVVQAAGEGFVGGAIMSPVIGGGFKAAGKAGHEIGSKFKGNNTSSAAGSAPSLSEIDKIARHDEINQANLSPHRFNDVSGKKAQKQVSDYLDNILAQIPENTPEAPSVSVVEKYADFILPDGTLISRNHAGDTGMPVLNEVTGKFEVPDVENAVLFWIKDAEGKEHVLPALTPENVSKAKRIISYMSNLQEIPRPEINEVQAKHLAKLKGKNEVAADAVETSLTKNADDVAQTSKPQGTVSAQKSQTKMSYTDFLNQYKDDLGKINPDIKRIADALYHDDYDKMTRIIQSCTHDGKLNTHELSIMADFLNLPKVNDDIIAVKSTYDTENIDYMRNRMYDNSRLSDEGLQLNNIDKTVEEQLNPESKYRVLGQKVMNKKTQQMVYIFENLRDAPDMNGLRAKNPLNGGNKKLPYIKSHLEKLKNAGIKTIIDFRAADVCSPKAIAMAEDMGFKYVRFTIDDTWSAKELEDMAKYIQAVNEGDFIAGCANGQARTDLAMAINYVFNPKAQNAPEFYYGNVNRSSRVSVRDSITKIFKAIEQYPEIVSQYGWKNYDEFIQVATKRFESIS